MKRATLLFGLVLFLSFVSSTGFAQAVDSDGDGLSDEFELSHGLDPNNGDSDGDGVADGNESDPSTGVIFEQEDGDGINDLPTGGTVGDDSNGGCSMLAQSAGPSGLWLFALLGLSLLFWRRKRTARLLS
ncbi:MAG: hypothetical protein KC609_00865 [Myxococcales bacterium]|nr:hypothetical protein [Myxococcales bacterium]